MAKLDTLSDAAHVQLYPLKPFTDEELSNKLLNSLQKLFVQFEREGACGAYELCCLESGAVLMIAYESGNEGSLSGCRKDKVSKLLLQFEEQNDVSIVNAPPMMVHVGQTWQSLSRAELKVLVQDKQVDLDSQAYNLRCLDLKTWREQAKLAIKDMWMRPIIERMLAN